MAPAASPRPMTPSGVAVALPDSMACPLPASSLCSGEDSAWHGHGDQPVRKVDHFADLEVTGDAAEDVRLMQADVLIGDEPLDHVPHGLLGVVEQVRSG